MRKKIVMVMGVQRSGTTALFDALSHGKITGYNETPGDYIYDNYYLRPEPELRALFNEVPGAVLLKPISETFRRSVREVFEEYSAYDLQIVWIYRDPVNATHSLQILGFKGPVPTVPELAEEWNRRNQSVLDALPFYPGRITIVCYEDLSDSPSMVAALGERLGIEALLNFRGDSAGGRRDMAPEFQALIDAVTRDTRARLDAARSILPGAGAPPRPCTAAPDASETAFVHDPLGQLREARERAGVYHHQQSDTWVVLRYDDVAASLADLERFACNIDYLAQNRFIGGQDLAFHERLRRLLEPHLTAEWTRLYTSRIEQRTRGILNELAAAGEFDLVSAFALRLYLDLGTEWSGGREAGSLMARITADTQFTPQEISDLRSSIPVFLKTLVNFIGNAVHHLLFHPNQEAALRARPADIPAFVDEVMRLFPPAFGVTRMTRQPIKMAGLEIPAEAQVVLAVFSANRDSARYEQPDEMLLHRNGPPHLSFSDGPEAWFVRRIGQLERETVLRVLLSEFPPLRPMCPAAEVRFAPSPEFYVPSALPVRFAA